MILERCVGEGVAQRIRAQSLILFLDICSLGDLIQSQSFRYHPYSDYSHICFSSCDFFSQYHTYMSNYLLVFPPGCLIATSSLAGLKWSSWFSPKLILTTVFLDSNRVHCKNFSYRNRKPRKGLRRKVSHLTSVFKGPLLRMDCKDKSRETSHEATAVI